MQLWIKANKCLISTTFWQDEQTKSSQTQKSMTNDSNCTARFKLDNKMRNYFKHADDFYNLYTKMKRSNKISKDKFLINDKKHYPITIIQAPITLNSNGWINVNQSIVLQKSQKKQLSSFDQYHSLQNQLVNGEGIENRSKMLKGWIMKKKSPLKSGERKSSVNRLDKQINSKKLKSYLLDANLQNGSKPSNLKLIPSCGVLKSNKAFNNWLSQSTFPLSK